MIDTLDKIPKRIVQVLVPAPLYDALDYALPDTVETVEIGTYVRVIMAGRTLTGVVWSANAPQAPLHKIRSLAEILPFTPMPASLRQFIDWVAAYTLQPKGAVLRLGLNADSAQVAHIATHYVLGTMPPSLRATPARTRILDLLQDGVPRIQAEIARQAACTASVVRGLIDEGVLIEGDGSEKPPAQPSLEGNSPTLSPEQQTAATCLEAAVVQQRFNVTVLEGVTGAGKTEVYAHAIRTALQQGKQVLVLMPEIALSVQMMGRFTKLFGAQPLLWHSELAGGARQKAWRAAAEGTGKLIMGARSALFLPFKNLGLIVIDEEHDGGYKQEDGVPYHARDMAVVRARLENIPTILSSASPSIETIVNVREGRYDHVMLPSRFAGASLPKIELLDLLRDQPPRQKWLAAHSVKMMKETLARGEQVLLFLNRRGYAPLTICRACGHRLTCPHCTAWLVEHRAGQYRGNMMCHHCGYHAPITNDCPQCKTEQALVPCGPGVERLEEEVKALFPDQKSLIVASDSLGNWQQVQEALAQVERGDVNIIIGTQIVAKGHHFPKLTLVIVVDADLGLEGGDVRAGERTYQLLQQVSGRAGRADLQGSVILQTHCANNFLFQTLIKNDREAFIEREIDMRAHHLWPPFARLAALIVSGNSLIDVEHAAREIRVKSPQIDGLEIFGPAPAPLARLKGEHRVRLLVRVDRAQKIQPILQNWLCNVRLPKGVDLKIVIDPFTFL